MKTTCSPTTATSAALPAVRVVDQRDQAGGLGEAGEQLVVIGGLVDAVGQHVRHERAEPVLAFVERDPRAVGGEDPAGLDVAQVAEHGRRAGGADVAAGVDLERGVAEVGVVVRLRRVDGVAAAGEDPLADRDPLVVGAARRYSRW